MEKKIVRLDEAQVKSVVKKVLRETWMNLNGRRESTNIEDRRGENNDYYELISNDIHKVYYLQAFVSLAGQDDAFMQLPNDKAVIKARENVQAAYNKASQFMGTFMQRAGIRVRNGVDAVRSVVREQGPVQSNTVTFSNYDIVGNMKRMIVGAASLFVAMVDNYMKLVQSGKMDPGKAFKAIKGAYSLIMDASS